MIDEPRITSMGNCLIGEYEPGNGTRYTAVAVPWSSDKLLGACGALEDGWLVIYGNTGRAYLLQKDGYLVDSYIQEHFGGHPGDYPHIGDLIRALIVRPGGFRIPRDFKYDPSKVHPHDDMPDDIEAYRNERAEQMP